MDRLVFFICGFLLSQFVFSQNTTVDCSSGPVSSSYCYGNNDNTQFEYVSSDDSPLILTIDSGLIEAGWDVIIVTDSNGCSVDLSFVLQDNNHFSYL